MGILIGVSDQNHNAIPGQGDNHCTIVPLYPCTSLLSYRSLSSHPSCVACCCAKLFLALCSRRTTRTPPLPLGGVTNNVSRSAGWCGGSSQVKKFETLRRLLNTQPFPDSVMIFVNDPIQVREGALECSVICSQRVLHVVCVCVWRFYKGVSSQQREALQRGTASRPEEGLRDIETSAAC